jgi:hypothetical protein
MMKALQEPPSDLFFFTGNTTRIYSDAKQKLKEMDGHSGGNARRYTMEANRKYIEI